MNKFGLICKSAIVILTWSGFYATNPKLDAECSIPADRSISWYPAGLDVFGGIPTSFAHSIPIAGLDRDGSVEDSLTINAAIAASSGDIVLTIYSRNYRIRNAT